MACHCLINEQSDSTDFAKAELWKNAISYHIEESFQVFVEPDPEADDFQNLAGSFLPKDTSLEKF